MPELLEIIGQDHALSHLQRAFAGRRRPHAYIFAGPEGVGRRTVAVEFAKLLLCERAVRRPNAGRLRDLPEDFPLHLACGTCRSCRTASAGTNGDLHLIYKELARYHDDPKVRERVMQELSIDVIRQFLIAPANRASSSGRGRVFIIRQAELMSVPAQNALLKTLEEPPARVTVILTCPGPGELLPTTRSRCQVVRFGPAPLEFAAKVLTDAGVEQTEAAFWAAFSDGAVGRASRLAAEGFYPFKRKLLERLSDLSAGGEVGLAETLISATDSHARLLKKRDADLAATLASRRSSQTILTLIASTYRDALTVACGADRPLVHADQDAHVRKIAARFDPSALAEILTQLARCEQLLWRNVNHKLLWDNVAITCATAAPLGL